MLLIPCPHCGPRDESEFHYGGRATALPELNATPSSWHEAVHLRQPVNAELQEYWFHSAGCEQWIKLQRDPATHAFVESQQYEGDDE